MKTYLKLHVSKIYENNDLIYRDCKLNEIKFSTNMRYDSFFCFIKILIENLKINDKTSQSTISESNIDFLTCDIHLFYLLLCFCFWFFHCDYTFFRNCITILSLTCNWTKREIRRMNELKCHVKNNWSIVLIEWKFNELSIK